MVAAESGLTPARALLDHRQARFALHLMARPRGGGGQEEILERRASALTARIRERSVLGRRETVEEQRWDTLRMFQGKVFVERKEEALRTAKEWKDLSRTAWTDGSRLENERVGAAVAWWGEGGWTGRGTHLGTNKEVSDTEVFAIPQAARPSSERNEEARLTRPSRIPRRRRPGPSTAIAALRRFWRERPSTGPTSSDREATASRCGGPRRMWAWRGTSTPMLWQSERQRVRRTWQPQSI